MKFYKVVNSKEGHNGLTYQDGLNVDHQEFNPSGDCESGGIYFAREDIFAFLSYGDTIYEVELPADAKVYENPGSPKKWKADRVILKNPMLLKSTETFNILIKDGANIHAYDDYALRWAAENEHLDVIKYLVENGADIHAYYDYALRWAAGEGHLDVVKYLKSIKRK